MLLELGSHCYAVLLVPNSFHFQTFLVWVNLLAYSHSFHQSSCWLPTQFKFHGNTRPKGGFYASAPLLYMCTSRWKVLSTYTRYPSQGYYFCGQTLWAMQPGEERAYVADATPGPFLQSIWKHQSSTKLSSVGSLNDWPWKDGGFLSSGPSSAERRWSETGWNQPSLHSTRSWLFIEICYRSCPTQLCDWTCRR